MTRQIIMPPSMMENRRALLVAGKEGAGACGGGHARRASVGEVAGETAADCAAVCCCCPCVLVNLVVLAVYKVPSGLCKKALRSKRRRRLMKARWPERQFSFSNDSELQIYHISSASSAVTISLESDKDVIELEKEMWEKFYGAGFWRSYSQRTDVSGLTELSR